MLQIFISYRRDDTRPMAERIAKALREDYGVDSVFLDVSHSIRAGSRWGSEILRALHEADVILIVIGSKWLDIKSTETPDMRRIDEPEDWVRREVRIALERELAGQAYVIPLLIDNAAIPHRNSLPDEIKELSGLQGIAIRNEPDFENDIANSTTSVKVASRNAEGFELEFGIEKQSLEAVVAVATKTMSSGIPSTSWERVR